MIPAPRSGRHDDLPPYPATTLAAAKAGDRQAFAELWHAHYGEVFRYAYYRLSDRATAEDITSETFIRAINKIGTFGEAWGGGFPAWLVTIARNLIADRYKSSRHRMEISVEEMLDADRTVDGPELDVLERLQGAALRDAVTQLNELQRECIELRYLRGLTVAETAQAMGSNEGAVKALTWRALRTLGRLIRTDPALADAGTR